MNQTSDKEIVTTRIKFGRQGMSTGAICTRPNKHKFVYSDRASNYYYYYYTFCIC